MSKEVNKRDYVSVIYDQKEKPLTQYPDLLTEYLVKRYQLSAGQKILDLGCGRGEFLRGFVRCGLKGYGVDESLAAKDLCSKSEILQSDLENEPLPYKDSSFDVIFSKSVLEHFYYPEKLVQEIYRVLNPGGLVITMTPDWQSVYKMFYEDYTHRTPFTVKSLEDIFKINGFSQVKAEKFRQLPLLWKLPWLNLLSGLIALITPKGLSSHSKWVRFSKEVMLLSSAVKPREGKNS
ncbi:MAG: class I SAM-dependent methyltransferase [Candidatus Omnitrophica bacterium]|nr:class I SAM-dependent methyltransferase [Candidatus Omnitrophota bacterium]